MSDKCPKCGAEVRWASRDSVGFACGVTQSTPKHPEINTVQTYGCYERQLARAREERDLAVAHDRQPYPTAEAYEAICKARTKWQERAEKAKAILRAANFCEPHEPIPAQPESGCPMCEAVHQADLREKAVERERRLREAAWPVADQVAEVVVMGADKSQCRLVPVGLLLTLREALAAKPQAPSAVEGEGG